MTSTGSRAGRSRVLFTVLVVLLLTLPTRSWAQADERLEANHLFGAFSQMGSAHMAAFLDAKVQLMQALTYLIDTARASKCIDPGPWIQIRNQLEAGASARAVFPQIMALTEMPNGRVFDQVNRYRCRCMDAAPPTPPTGDKTASCQRYANTAVGQNEENLRKKCGYTGSKWQSSFENHFTWCMVTAQAGWAESENSLRDEELKRCAKGDTGGGGGGGGGGDRGDVEDITCDRHIADRANRSDGTRFTFRCDPRCSLTPVWGSDPYTMDSAICSAAVHAGRLDWAAGGTVTVTLGTADAVFGGARNGVPSEPFARPGQRVYTFEGGIARAPDPGRFKLARIIVSRTYEGGGWAANALQPGQHVHDPGQRRFPMGWDFPWTSPSGQYVNRAAAEVTLTEVPTTVEPGGTVRLALSMTGEWNTSGYGVGRDHTIRVEGAAGTTEWSQGGDPNGLYHGGLESDSAFTVPATPGRQVVMTIVTMLRFGGDHLGRMEIQFVYEP